VPIPLDGVRELFDRTPGHRRMFVLRRGDPHRLVGVERMVMRHGCHPIAARRSSAPGIRPRCGHVGTLPWCVAHDFVRGLTLAHLDATVRESHAAEIPGNGAVCRARCPGVDATAHAGC
jgi:hypothetical protein